MKSEMSLLMRWKAKNPGICHAGKGGIVIGGAEGCTKLGSGWSSPSKDELGAFLNSPHNDCQLNETSKTIGRGKRRNKNKVLKVWTTKLFISVQNTI